MTELVTPDTALLGAPRSTAERCAAYLLSRPHGEYSAADIQAIVAVYFRVCAPIDLDPLLAVAQVIHETGGLTSWWSQRPRRNPAGIGVTGYSVSRDMQRAYPERYPRDAWALGADGTRWYEGCSFASWANDAIPAHVGRLLAYATPLSARLSLSAQALLSRALSIRLLPTNYHGVAPTLRGLNGRWAVPGTDYADRVAAVANEIRSA